MKSEIPDRGPRPGGSVVPPEHRMLPAPGNPRPDLAADDYPPTRCPDSLPSGALFAGRYKILRELGRGGMGTVSLASDTRLPRDVAIKVPLRFQDADSRRRFFNEAGAAAKLDHPNICRILDLGEADGLPFIVMTFIPGQSLAEIVDHRPVGSIRAAKIARRIARTIQFAHDRGIIHRDLKPANLMVGPHRSLVVMDFGLARLEGDERKTMTGQVFGTLPYMSPEQVKGQAGDLGKCCDIYSLGVIFYELLTGRLPFRGSAWDLSRQIIQVAPSFPSSIVSGVDPALDAIVLKAMSKEIRDRFGSMAEFSEAIAAYLRGVGSFSSSDLTPRAPAIAGPGASGPAVDPDPERPRADFSIRVRNEPLRGLARRRPKSRDGLIWAIMAVLGLIVVQILIMYERRAAGPAASDLKAGSKALRPIANDPENGCVVPPKAPRAGPSTTRHPPSPVR